MSGKKTAPSRGSRGLAVLALIVGLVLGRFACAPSGDRAGGVMADHGTHTSKASVWTCSMHPQIQLPEPGDCPICGMDLVPVISDDVLDDASASDNPRELRLSEKALALAAVQTQPVLRRAVSREVRMVGKVTYDETLLSTITAWVPSRLDRLFVDYTGITVRKGDHIAEVYSPDLIATQQELLQALATERALEGNDLNVLSSRQSSTVQAARDRLRLWGLEESQIDGVVARGEPLEHITIRSPATGVVIHKDAVQGQTVQTGTRLFTIADLSSLWVQLEAYESDLPWLHYGQHVDFRSEAWPGEVFHGRISFIDPVLDDRTRTVKVRLNVDNAEGKLKPAMFVRATLQAPINSSGALVDAEFADQWMCPMHPEVVSPEAGACSRCGMDLVPTEELGFRAAADGELPLVIPRSAPLITGKRAVVFVQRLDGDRRVFESRDVVLGPRAGEWYVVEAGLAEGDAVVVNGAFKLDSELQIRARPSMMNPDGGGPAPGHQHGGGGGAPAVSGGQGDARAGHAGHAMPSSAGVPAAFREQLGATLGPYLQVQTALAADDAAAASLSAAQLEAAFAEIDASALLASHREHWSATSAQLDEATRALIGGTSIEASRAAFQRLSDALIAALQAFGFSAVDAPVAVFHCPMAFDDGADWIQSGERTSNPYFGASMLRCGDRQFVLEGER